MKQHILKTLEIYPWVKRKTPHFLLIDLEGQTTSASKLLLDNLLQAVKINPNEIYSLILNHDDKKETNQHKITETIQFMQPSVIVLLGDKNVQHYDIAERPLYVMPHPNHLLKHPTQKKNAYHDWMKMKQYSNNLLNNNRNFV